MPTKKKQKWAFTGIVENFNTRLWKHHVKLPVTIAKTLHENGIKRIRVTINDEATIASGLLPAGNDVYFILLNKKLRDSLKIDENSRIHVSIVEDDSQYGMDMPEELLECLKSDSVGDKYFHALTPGKQRDLIYIASNVKNPELRIARSLIILDHLKHQKGKLDFKLLYQSLKKQ